MKLFGRVLLLVFFVCVLLQSAVYSQGDNVSGLGPGIRGGFGLSPDQFVVGAQYSLGKKVRILRVVPSLDVGFGDNVTTLTFNGDFLGRLILEDTNIGLYGGAGLTLAYWGYDSGSDWKPGLTLVFGTQVPLFKNNATNLEARFGLGDVPDFRLLLAFIL